MSTDPDFIQTLSLCSATKLLAQSASKGGYTQNKVCCLDKNPSESSLCKKSSDLGVGHSSARHMSHYIPDVQCPSKSVPLRFCLAISQMAQPASCLKSSRPGSSQPGLGS
ncbi:hypothetical protein WJX77_009958 [Trebouxia sp. C0004]